MDKDLYVSVYHTLYVFIYIQNLWWIRFDIWQNQNNIVKLKNKIKKYKKIKKQQKNKSKLKKQKPKQTYKYNKTDTDSQIQRTHE